jgi:hypothetical protein
MEAIQHVITELPVVKSIGDDSFVIKAHFGKIRRITQLDLLCFLSCSWRCVVDRTTPIGSTHVPSFVTIRGIIETNEGDDLDIESDFFCDFTETR